MEKPEDLMPALQQAVAQKKPTIVDIVVDADEAPMPPQMTTDTLPDMRNIW